MTGELASDRRQIHKLADSIHKILFQEEGIASTQILFAYKNQRENSKEWTSEIWECDYDGANPHQLTHERSYCVTPVSMPQRLGYIDNHFLYVSYKIGQPKIYVGDRKGGTSKRLVDLRGNQLLPAVSSQRDKVAFICDAGGRTDLFLQSFDPKTGQVGKPIQLYSHPRSTQASPTFTTRSEILGGNGYTNDYPLGRLLRDAKLYEIGAGTSEIRRMLIGRELFAKGE